MAGWDQVRFLSVMRLSHTGGGVLMPPGGFFAPSILTCLSGKERTFLLQFSELTIYIHANRFFFSWAQARERHQRQSEGSRGLFYFSHTLTFALPWVGILWKNCLYCCSILHFQHVFSKYCNDRRFFTLGHIKPKSLTIIKPSDFFFFVKFASCMTKKKKWWEHAKLIFLNLFIESN